MNRIPLSVRRRWDRAAAWARANRDRAHPECGAVGCAACCRSDVVSDRREAGAIFPLLTRQQLQELRSRVPPTSGASEEPPGSTKALGLLTRYGAPCVFLAADRTCSIYRQRPALCRTYMVVTPPADCDPANGPATIGSVVGPELLDVLPRPDHPDTGMLIDLLLELDRDQGSHDRS